MARVCNERDKRYLFRSWSRLCLHAASFKAASATGGVDVATTRVAGVDHIERGDTAAVQRDDVAAEEVGDAAVRAAKLLERAHEAERALGDQKRQLAGRLVRWGLCICEMVLPSPLLLWGLALVGGERENLAPCSSV